jgi:hypothetical protein
MFVSNPYLAFYQSLPASFRRNPHVPPDSRELAYPDWLNFKAAIASHFSWAVPTTEAIATIRKYTDATIEIGAGNGYWAWLMEQVGISALAYDVEMPLFTWHPVALGNELAVQYHPGRTLFLCWPPYASDMAYNALSLYSGDLVIYVGEWPGGCAEPKFFALLGALFAELESLPIPQWFMRDDRLRVFRRRGIPRMNAAGSRKGEPHPVTPGADSRSVNPRPPTRPTPTDRANRVPIAATQLAASSVII